MRTNFQSENLKRRKHLGDLGVDGKIIYLNEIRYKDRVQWQVLVKTMELRIV
jgi:hypothetical protein